MRRAAEHRRVGYLAPPPPPPRGGAVYAVTPARRNKSAETAISAGR